MTGKKRTPRTRARQPKRGKDTKSPKVAPTPKSGPDRDEPFVNVVVVDNNVPGGFRYEQRPTDAARTNR